MPGRCRRRHHPTNGTHQRMTQERLATRIRNLGNRLAVFGWAIDSRLALAGGISALDRRARLRQQAIVHWARVASPFYRELYRGLPPRIEHFSDLPPVTKPQLMARFDDWLTDPAVTLADLRPWLADPSGIGSLYRGKYLVYTTSGTTGDPAVLVQDRRALSLYLASRVRMYPVILDREVLARVARGHGRMAALLATGGHYGGVVMAEWARRLPPAGPQPGDVLRRRPAGRDCRRAEPAATGHRLRLCLGPHPPGRRSRGGAADDRSGARLLDRRRADPGCPRPDRRRLEHAPHRGVRRLGGGGDRLRLSRRKPAPECGLGDARAGRRALPARSRSECRRTRC